MSNFKKAYITKIICIFIVNSFVVTNFTYSYPSNYPDALRVPVDIENTQERMKEVIEKTDKATLKDKKDLPSYASMVDIFSNKLNKREELDEKGVEPARKKFNQMTLKSEIFSGNTVVAWFDEETNKKLREFKINIETKLKQLALENPDKYGDLPKKIAFVKEDSFHITLYDLVNPDDFKSLSEKDREKYQKEINEKILGIFKYLIEQENLSPIQVEIKTLGSFAPFLLLALGYPKTQEDLNRINTIRETINKGTGINLANPFVAHITLGYIVNPMNEDEYAAYKEIVNEIMGEAGFKLDIILDNLQLREFKTMDDYGRDPIERVNLASGETVLEIANPKSSQIGLVGGKAASLKELGSIEGVKVPDGFNVTTKVYADYLKSVGAEPLINKLEILSEEWKKLDEKNSAREELTVQMRELSWKIQNLILKGNISSEIRQVVLYSYKNLEKDRIPALVAVRSSATAEDMPGASFAGQYRTYLNIQGDDQVIEAIKKVWASTYEMNAVEYRNKQNMQHSKNKMCALILEMVNPQSAGTAFTVDLETGAPFISINNTYGLGEAEVSGIVTSDTWIIDPNTGTILKRRIGEKGKKIVYDPIRKINITMDTSVSDREKFAISKSKAKEIATLVKKIQQHYVKKNPDLNHMDIEYAVTDDGRIVFTQARPETVWTSGKRSLIAINAKEVEAKNKEAVKAGIELPYPEIFKGGVSGSPGVARGILRVVTSVQEAEESVKPGDIMIAPNTTNAWEHVMSRTSGIITEIGGPGNHTAVVSREQEKAAIVGAVGAMESLRIYSGKMVTLDATSKRVYLNDIPDSFKYMPDKVEPEYGGLFSQNLDESWAEAQRTMTTAQDPDGMRWIDKPNQKVRVFLQEIFTRSHHQVAEMLNLNIKDRVKVDEENKNVGVYQVDFNTIFPWMTKLAEKPLEGADSLSSIHEARVANVRDFLQKSEDLELTTTSVKAWLDSFITLNAYMGFAYNMYRITEGLLQEALKEKHIPEPYLSQVWLSMAAWVGETEAIKRNRDYGQLLEDVKNDRRLYETLKNALINTDKEFNELAVSYPAFYSRFSEHAFNYKIMKNADDIFTSDPFHFLLAKELLKDADNHRTIVIYDTKPEQFYPEDQKFERIARLAFFSEKLRQDAHHFKVRGQWKFVEVLRPLAAFLIEKGEIKSFGGIFDHTPEWILDKVGKYEKAGSPNASVKPLFHIKQYQIQNLEVPADEYVAEDNAKASLTTIGRWKFESAQWDETAGWLTLVNATRIEQEVKPEFLENGQHLPKNITLSTRRLNDQERDKVDNLAKHLGVDISKIVVIRLDQIATFHRIYGLYVDGVLFIREDILSEGSQDEIYEALDHLRLTPTGFNYEALKNIKYYGNLRDLITKLSHRTIKAKLFAQNPEEESNLLKLKEDLGLSDRDYDFITREMIRRRISFEEARLLLQEYKLREKVGVRRQPRVDI